MGSLTEANTTFSADFFKTLLKNHPKENIFFSPMSISAALGMVLLGAEGVTAEQMKKVLHFDKITGSGSSSPKDAGAQCDSPGGPHSQFKALLAAINTHTKNYALNTANKIYASNQYDFHQKFLGCTKEMYGAELETLDFRHDIEEAIKKINSWVEGQTNGKIKDLLAPNSVPRDAALVLVNAIYFKGKWKREFKKTDTKETPFWINENQSKNVQMMYQEHEFNWAEIKNPKMKVLELPYDQHDLSMIVFLPGDKGAVDQVMKDFTYAKLQQWTCSSNMQKQVVKLWLPRFKLEATYELKGILEDLGMREAFTNKADLSGMSKSQLALSKVFHKAYVEVNEEGTEAAGATGVVVVPVSAKVLPEFKADHPFMFCIKHNKTHSILFWGKVASP